MSTTRKLPDHGTYARANGSPGRRAGCKCDRCAPVMRAAKKRQALNSALGRRARIDAAPARAWLQVIRPTMGWHSLTLATGLNWHTLQNILTGEREQISHHTHRKIMAARPANEPDPGMYIDATGSIRKLRAMQVVGHSYRAMAELAESSDSRLQKIAYGHQPTVRYSLAKKIDAAYRELAHNPPPQGRASTNTRRRAAAKRWHGPLAWDLATIDDPQVEPEADQPDPELKRHELAAQRRDEIELLASACISNEEIARRVGVTIGTVREIRAELRNGKKRDRTKAAA
jgi:hypothetical protein